MALLAAGGIWLRVAAVSGASAVALGAYGAHSFRPQACTIQYATLRDGIPLIDKCKSNVRT